MTSTKIQSTHCDRMAFVYVRQSTPLQVIENRESTERQYHLRERAIELGWPPSRVEVIDEDQGRSGSTAAHRTGFQRLAAEVVLGKVGIVLMLEASRLARNNSDWYRLIEICGVSGTLIADEGAVYNPREPNDRLLLGVKGTLSEAELFTLRTRLYEGRWNKARKGLLRFPLPVGYVQTVEGDWTVDPNTQVRERLDYIFDSFRRHGVVRAVVRDLKEQGLELPTRLTAKEGYGSLVWKVPTLSAVIRILHNPAYAGAYVYGRWEYVSEKRSPKTGKASAHARSVAQWPVKIPAHHPAYIRWEEFVKNQEQLRQNWSHDGNRGVPREGWALLQGIVTDPPPHLLAFVALFIVALAETGRVPVDNPATHLELTMIHEAMILEYSGRYLALVEWASALKLLLFLTLLSNIFAPWGIATEVEPAWMALGLVVWLVKVSGLAVVIGVIESMFAKLRLFRVTDLLGVAFILSLLAVVFFYILRV